MTDCLFCKIVAKEIPSEKVFEDDDFYAFRDINPKADTHLLLIPKKHIVNLDDLQPEDEVLMGKIMLTVPKLAKQEKLAGYRTITNTGAKGGQEVFHLHLHILGGSELPGF
jgi:histidine triad (HIT) family protein